MSWMSVERTRETLGMGVLAGGIEGEVSIAGGGTSIGAGIGAKIVGATSPTS